MANDRPDPEARRFGREEVADGENYATRGEAAKHAWGVQYQGPFESISDGTSRAVRLHARALAQQGVPVLLQSFTNTFIGPEGVRIGAEAMSDEVRKETFELRHASIGETRVRIKHMVVTNADMLRSYIIPASVSIERDMDRAIAMRSALYRSTIVYSVWERSTIEPQVASILARVGECWVPCEQNRQLLVAHGVDRVRVVPHPWETTSDIAKLVRRAPKDRKDFYAIGIWQPRKHFHETVGGFLLAFRPGDRASLTIKARDARVPGYPTKRESVAYWLAQERVKMLGWTEKNLASHLWLPPDEEWPEDKITKLHHDSNIYVAASRGEAYCLPAADAKVAGNRMVYVGYGGMRDFADARDIMVPYAMRPVPKEYGWEDGAEWAEAPVESIAHAMKIVEPPHVYEWSAAILARTMENVGELMKRGVDELVERNASHG